MPNDSSSAGSVTLLIERLRTGDPAAIGILWDYYFESIVRLAREELRNYPRRVADEEDIATSVMQCLCNGVDRGKFPELESRHDLWCLLVVLTRHKSADLLRRHSSKKRGKGKVRGDSVFAATDHAEVPAGFDQIVSRSPTPETLAAMNEEYLRLMALLDERPLQQIVQWKLECYTNQEIAEKLNLSISTVERKLKRIRETWLREVD